MLRTASVEIIRYLKIEGGCNVQYALNPDSNEYIVIEVNPRVSRSSALASKATGYPIAKVAAKIAVGMTLDQITNAVTGETKACFEPTLDYVVTKFPRWPFEKFNLADRTLGTQMKATGEVMAIDRSLEGSLLKAIRSLEIGLDHIELKKIAHESIEQLIERLHLVDDERIYVVAEALRKGISVEKIQESLSQYKPAERRFSEHKIGNSVVVDDYAHHPSEIKATINSARRKYADKEVIAIFQPHTYTRTAKFLNEFAESLETADKVFLCPIFASVREKEKIVGIEDLQKVTKGAQIINSEEDFDKLNFDNSVFLFMGAGNINKLCYKFIEQKSK